MWESAIIINKLVSSMEYKTMFLKLNINNFSMEEYYRRVDCNLCYITIWRQRVINSHKRNIKMNCNYALLRYNINLIEKYYFFNIT